MTKPIKVLIVEDSLLFREMLHHELERDSNIKVVGKAADAIEAGRKITECLPDLIIVDVYMDRMSGTEFVRQLLPQYYLPVIIISSDPEKRTEAENCGAVAFFHKPDSGNMRRDHAFFRMISLKIKSVMAGEKQSYTLEETEKIASRVIAIGASTGGAEAIENLLKELPAVMPPIVISQHMPAKFTKTFANRLNNVCRLSVKEAKDGDILIPGQVYIAPGGNHMSLKRRDNRYFILCEANTLENPVSPSVDRLFASVAEAVKSDAVGVILTGMGKDGAVGLKKMRDAGCYTIGQDETSAVIYGMPKAAYEMGAVNVQLPLENIPKRLIDLGLKL